MAETNNISGAADAPEQNNTSSPGAPEEQHDHEHHHEHHHHHHHHRSPAPIHEMHKVQRRVRHTMKHMQKWQIVTALAAAVFAAAVLTSSMAFAAAVLTSGMAFADETAAPEEQSSDEPIRLRVCNWEEYIDLGDWD